MFEKKRAIAKDSANPFFPLQMTTYAHTRMSIYEKRVLVDIIYLSKLTENSNDMSDDTPKVILAGNAPEGIQNAIQLINTDKYPGKYNCNT